MATGVAWWVTAKWTPGKRKVYQYDGRGKIIGWAEEIIESAAEFHWIVYAEDADAASEKVRTAGYFCGGLDSQFTCTAYEVAVLDFGRPAKVHEQQFGRDEVASEAEVRSNPAASDESASSRILRLAQRFREFVVQV